MRNRPAEFGVILLLAAAACNGESKRDNTVREQSADEHQEQPAAAVNAEHHPADQPEYTPQQVTDSISIEGMPEPMVLNLVRPESTMPFLTYVPEDMIFEPSASDTSERYFFYTNFAGKKNEQAYLMLAFLPAGTTRERAAAAVQDWKAQHDARGFFSDAELRTHDDRFYIVARHFPVEYGDGFGPRAARILERLKWLPY